MINRSSESLFPMTQFAPVHSALFQPFPRSLETLRCDSRSFSLGCDNGDVYKNVAEK